MIQKQKPPVIAIDGGAGTGKGALRAFLARLLRFNSLDSGVLYRAVGFKMYSEKIDLKDISSLKMTAKNLNINMKGELVFIDGIDQTTVVRSDDIGGKYAALVAKIPEVRMALRDFQLSMRKEPGLVADGRDQGFIFDTPFRFFLKTDPKIRAERRVLQFKKMGLPADYNKILEEILRRDDSDLYNPANPLVPHPEAFIIVNDRLSIKETAKIVLLKCCDVIN